MERLTNKREADQQRINYEKRMEQGYPRNIPEERFLKLAAYEDTGLEPGEIPSALEMAQLVAAMDKLQKYEDAKKNGRLVILPCIPGLKPTNQNAIVVIEDGEIWDDYVTEVIIGQDNSGGMETMFFTLDGEAFDSGAFGKTVFLTREEAEAALRGGGSDG